MIERFLVGGCIIVLLGMLVSRVAFDNKAPRERAFLTFAVAWLLAVLGASAVQGIGELPDIAFGFLLPAVLLALLFWWTFKQQWVDDNDPAAPGFVEGARPLFPRWVMMLGMVVGITILTKLTTPLWFTPKAEAATARSMAIDAATALRAQLPMKLSDRATATGVAVDGEKVIQSVSVSVPLSKSIMNRLRRADHARACENDQWRLFIERGGSLEVVYTDTTGKRFESSVSTCVSASL